MVKELKIDAMYAGKYVALKSRKEESIAHLLSILNNTKINFLGFSPPFVKTTEGRHYPVCKGRIGKRPWFNRDCQARVVG